MATKVDWSKFFWSISLKCRKGIVLCNQSNISRTTKSAAVLEELINKYISEKINKQLRCRVFWENDNEFNAKAIRAMLFKNSYCIVLNYEIINSLINFSFDKNCRIKNNNISNLDISTYNVFNLKTNISSGNTRANRVYNQADIYTIFIILCFLINHELGHIIYGHSRKKDILDGILGQTKEYEVDCFSFERTFETGISIFGYENADIFAYSLYIICDFFKKQRTTQKVVDIKDHPLNSLRRILKILKPKKAKDKLNNHPDPLIRLYYLYECLKAKIRNPRCPLAPNEKKAFLNKCDSLFMKAHTTIEEQNWIKQKYEKEQTDKIKENLEMIQKRYESYF